MVLAFHFLQKKTNNCDRHLGKTMVMDKNLSLRAVDDLLATAGDYISFVKFGWGTAATMDRELVMEKTAKYSAAGIIPYPGGTLLEVALLNDKFEEFLTECAALGFKGIEVSDGSTTIDVAMRCRAIERAKAAGFFVISEVGKKDPEKDHALSTVDRLALIKNDLAHGSSYVIIEAREAGKNVGFYDENGQIMDDELDALCADGIEHLIFEAPLKDQQVDLILKFGPHVNFGNIAPADATSLETLRRGLRGDTVGKV